ncbi:hypothetical protein AB6F62_11150 [Providencia huaxiensis]|uniref:hypothetical protein n=1 Tax=Providencia huaxiensis TaxID=2027290 RepID=UPI0034DDBA3C
MGKIEIGEVFLENGNLILIMPQAINENKGTEQGILSGKKVIKNKGFTVKKKNER